MKDFDERLAIKAEEYLHEGDFKAGAIWMRLQMVQDLHDEWVKGFESAKAIFDMEKIDKLYCDNCGKCQPLCEAIDVWVIIDKRILCLRCQIKMGK